MKILGMGTAGPLGASNSCLLSIFAFTSVLCPLTDAASEALDSWEWRQPLPQGNDLRGLAWHNGLGVAVGDYGTVLTSSNGQQWSVRSLERNLFLRTVCFGNERFVALGSDAKGLDVILTSTNGMDWAQHSTTETTNYFQSVAWGNGRFVAAASEPPGWPISNKPHLFSSVGGAYWTPHLLATNPPLYSVAWGEPGFVVASTTVFHYSADGVNWETVPNPTNFPSSFTGVIYANGRFLALRSFYYGGSSTLLPLLSTNGRDWVTGAPLPVPPPGAWMGTACAAYGNGHYLAMAEWAGLTNIRWSSGDGLTWTLQPALPALQRPTALVWIGNEFVAAGEFGNLAVSSDGENWSFASWATSNNHRGAAYGQNQFVIVGNNGTNMTSPDGIHWTAHPPPTPANLHDVVFANGQWVAAGGGGVILTSRNGSDWAQQTSGTTEDLFGIAWGNGTFVAVGGDSTGDEHPAYFHCLLTSPDGTNWTTRLSGAGRTSFRLHGVTFGGGQFIAVGGPRVTLRSTDGIMWVAPTNVGWGYLKDVVWGNGRFVAVGETTSVWSSSDGANWQDHLISTNWGQYDEVEYGDGVFVAVGDGGAIYTSADGVEWLQRRSPTGTNLRGLTFGQGTFLIAGNNDTILQSLPLPIRLLGQMSAAGFELGFPNAADRTLALDWSTNLVHWTPLFTLSNVASGDRWTDTESGWSGRFYRVAPASH